MGSGYINKAYAFRAMAKHLSAEDQKTAMEALGLNFLVDQFVAGLADLEDFVTRSKVAAELVHKAVKRDMEHLTNSSVDLREQPNGTFKVSFFK